MPKVNNFNGCNTCLCGAAQANGYEHYGDCLANLKSADLIPYWNRGWNAYIKAGEGETVSPRNLEAEKTLAWVMGMSTAAYVKRTNPKSKKFKLHDNVQVPEPELL